MKRKLAFMLSLVLVLSLVLSGCGKNKEPESVDSLKEGEEASKQKEVKIDDEQYVILTQAEPQAIDPSKSSDIYSSEILNGITEGLVRLEVDKDGKDIIAPAGAKKWDVSDDGLVWTFYLRDYNWEDGKPVTAQDFEYGIKRTINPKIASVYAFLLYPIKNAEACNNGEKEVDELGVKVLNDKTLEITLEGPCAYFEKLIPFKTMYPQRKDIVEKNGDKNGTEAEYTISCGPFKLTEWTHKSELILEKNDSYWDKDSVKLEKIIYKIIEDPNTRANMIYNGQLDICGVTKPEWVEKLRAKNDIIYKSDFRPNTLYAFFNQENKLFSNINIRKAFILALDREELIDVLYYGIGEAAYGWVPPTMMIGEDEYRNLVEEPIKKLKEENSDPKKLLVKGLEELGMDPDPSKATITMLQSGTSAEARRFVEYYQQRYETVLGINVETEQLDWPVFLDRTQNGEYEMASMGWVGDYNDPMTFLDMWMSGSQMSNTGWSNKKYDELIDKAKMSLDNEERLEYFKQAEEILLYEDAVISPTRYTKTSTFMYDYVKGAMRPLFGSGMEFKYAYIEGRNK